jgi:hypothetical protein
VKIQGGWLCGPTNRLAGYVGPLLNYYMAGYVGPLLDY